MTFDDPAFLTGLGAALAIFLTATGSAIGAAHGGVFAMRHASYMYFVPVVQAGVLGVYGVIIGVLLCGKLNNNENVLTPLEGYKHLSAGLSVGLAGWASGYGMAIFMKQSNQEKLAVPVVRATGDREPLLNSTTPASYAPPDIKKLILVMIFLESIGLYGLIVALFLIGW